MQSITTVSNQSVWKHATPCRQCTRLCSKNVTVWSTVSWCYEMVAEWVLRQQSDSRISLFNGAAWSSIKGTSKVTIISQTCNTQGRGWAWIKFKIYSTLDQHGHRKSNTSKPVKSGNSHIRGRKGDIFNSQKCWLSFVFNCHFPLSPLLLFV